jgi:hypothetical protein
MQNYVDMNVILKTSKVVVGGAIYKLILPLLVSAEKIYST